MTRLILLSSGSQTGVRGPFGTAKQFQTDREGNVKSSTVAVIFYFILLDPSLCLLYRNVG